MWPFSEMSLSAASLIGTIANWTLLISLLGGVLSTFVIVKTTDVKEEHWAEDRKHSNEKIAEVGARGDEARAELAAAQADIAKAHAAIAEATARAAEANQKAEEERLARVKLEARMAPRVLVQAQQNQITEKIREFKIRETTLLASPATSENEWLVRLLAAPLIAAGWNVKLLPGTATATVLFPRGIVVYARLPPDGRYFPDQDQTPDLAAAHGLARVLNGLEIETTVIPDPEVLPECIRIVVNSR